MFVFMLAVADLLVGLSMPYHVATLIVPTVTNNFYACLFRYFSIAFPALTSVLLLLGKFTKCSSLPVNFHTDFYQDDDPSFDLKNFVCCTLRQKNRRLASSK